LSFDRRIFPFGLFDVLNIINLQNSFVMETKKVFIGLVLVALSVGIFSCSHDGIPIENDDFTAKELIPVSFSVGFTKNITEFRSGEASSLTGYDFYYLVYNSETGVLYKNLKYGYSDNFDGVINDSLPVGNYTIVFCAANIIARSIESHYSGQSIKYAHYSLDYPYFEITYPALIGDGPQINRNSDVFFSKVNVAVEKNGQNNQSITLNRIVGKIEVILQDDTIPGEVTSVEIAVNSDPQRFYYSSDSDFSTGISIGSSFNILPNKIVNGYSFYFNAFENINPDQSRYPVSITLTARRSIPAGVVDYGQSVVVTKVIDNVDILKNQTVVYTGKLFDNLTPPPPDTNPPSSFSISLDDTWGDTIAKPF
jgi:hypothetical protein